MASRSSQRKNQNNRFVSGNLAYDYDYLDRERRSSSQQDHWEREERREYERVSHTQPKKRQAAAPRRRERIRISPLAVLGYAVTAVLMVALINCYAELTEVSRSVASMQQELAELEEEHVSLLGRYERVFDLSAIKNAAEAAGMAKPSASQVYYIDLSAPDSVVLYQGADANLLERVFASVGQDVFSLVEYFK
jgi:cell division protein FtsL